MNTTRSYRQISWLIIVCLILISLVIQLNIFINGDTSWSIEIFNRLMHGKRYYYDIFEVNPPLAPFLYAPSLLLAKVLHVRLRYTLIAYLFSLFLGCFFVARHCLLRILTYTKTHYYLLLVGIAFIEFNLFTYSFGEREQLMLTLVLPYILLAILQVYQTSCQHPSKHLSIKLRVLVGLMAAFGFCLKPYFFITFAFVELYLMWFHRSLKRCLRIESILPVAFGVIYVLLVWWLFPNYLLKVVPLTARLYLPYYNLSWPALLNNSLTYFLLITLALVVWGIKGKRLKPMYFLFSLAALGFYGSYLFQLKPWYYHKLPCIAMACLLLSMLAYDAIAYARLHYKKTLFAMVQLCLSLYLLIYPLNNLVLRAANAIDSYHSSKKISNHFIRFIQQHHYHGTIIPLSSTMAPVTYIVQSTQLRSGSRYGNAAILLVGLLHLERSGKPLPAFFSSAKRYFLQSNYEDITQHQPCYLLVDEHRYKKYFGTIQVNLLTYLAQDRRLKTVLANYHSVYKYDGYNLYAPQK
jgi:hypothetical protein